MMYNYLQKDNWLEILDCLKLTDDASTFEKLINTQNEKTRAYHNLQHLNECFEKLEWAKTQLSNFDFDGVALALWFHDAVYNPRANNNEAKSNEWAQDFLRGARASLALQEKVERYIMATLHQNKPEDPNAQLMVDIDLSILGATQAQFAEYEKQVRKEYAWVPWFLYKKRRKAVLQHFLAMDSIYLLDCFKERFETQARINLQNAFNTLS